MVEVIGSTMITVVSGVPRSGTSLMMQMLSAGGMAVLTDDERAPDASNPRGYYELEWVKSLARDSGIVAQADGKVIKVVSSLLRFLPSEQEYRIIFMRRPLDEVIASQDRMLGRLGKEVSPAPRGSVLKAFEEHLKEVEHWISQQSNIVALYVEYLAVLRNTRWEATRLSTFLGRSLDVESMVRQVDTSLHRERSSV